MHKLIKKICQRFMPELGCSNEKTRKEWIKGVLESLPCGFNILDAGAGEQQYRQFCSHLVYVSQDFAQYDGVGNGEGLQTQKWEYSKLDIVSDICSIPVEDESFDAVMCTEVFEHLPNPCLALQEFSRIIRPGGKLIITAPFCSLTHFAPFHFSTGFNRYYYETNLAECGFEILEITANGNYFEYIAQELYRLGTVSNEYAGKNLTFIDKCAVYFVILILKKLSKIDKGSSELLNFGYHVVAEKMVECKQ